MIGRTPRPIPFRKVSGGLVQPQDVLAELDSFLNQSTPDLAYILENAFGRMQNEITYRDLERAIQGGYLSDAWIRQWQIEYSMLVRDDIAPLWDMAIRRGAAAVKAKYGLNAVDLTFPHIRNYIDHHSAEFVTNVTRTQKEAMRAMIRRASLTTDMTVDELARVIRPTIGLTRPQGNALVSYYQDLKDAGYTDDEAKHRQLRRASQMHRQRAGTIAQYEMSDAYNAGSVAQLRQAYQNREIHRPVKVWRTERTESVCDVCSALEGVRCELDDNFQIPPNMTGLKTKANARELQGQLGRMFHRDRPPMHPHCRCALDTIFVDE